MGKQIPYPMPSDSPRLQSFNAAATSSQIQEQSDGVPATTVQVTKAKLTLKPESTKWLQALKLLANFHSPAVDVFVISQKTNHRIGAEDH